MRKINRIEKIKIENIKGKDLFELKFNELHANFPNLFVAPNGFGKSTIATSFKALKPSKIELDKEDFFEGQEDNRPSLEIELTLNSTNKSLVADSSKNDISSLIDTYVIKSPVYAKSTSRRYGGFSSQSARLDVEDLVFYDKIPHKAEVDYKLQDIKDQYGAKGKVFSNISMVFKELKNLDLLCMNHSDFRKASTQIKTQSAIHEFMQRVSDIGSGKQIREKITRDTIKIIKDNILLSNLLKVVESLEKLPFSVNEEVNLIFTLIQIIEVIKKDSGNIKKARKYVDYLTYRKDIDDKLNMFNTTGRKIKTKETKDKLVVEFLSANKMSNGERDVLSFISNLSKFKVKFKKDIGILLIDEIFDYLDGSNMLIVQYYLSKFIEEFRHDGKVLFPIILTHLDPILFNNYYFKKPKIHYLKNYSYAEDTTMVNLLKVRSNKSDYKELAENIEKHYLHFHPEKFRFTDPYKILINNEDYHDSVSFYELINNEFEKFLEGKKYDPLKIICAIRVKIEKIVYSWLSNEGEKSQYINIHTTIKKLNYAIELGISVPEDFTLLQPLYNDALHLTENTNATRNKIQSICLKLDNIVVQKIIGTIHETEGSNLI